MVISQNTRNAPHPRVFGYIYLANSPYQAYLEMVYLLCLTNRHCNPHRVGLPSSG